jgi:transcriptional regulator with XRE-family HTH domain
VPSPAIALTRQQLAAAITARRAELRLTQAALARKAAVSSRTIWNIEHSDRQPRPGSLHAILTALGMTAQDAAPPAHGTDNGYKRHVKRMEVACTPCLRAHAAYQGEYNQRGKCAKGLGWPLLPGPAEVTSRG